MFCSIKNCTCTLSDRIIFKFPSDTAVKYHWLVNCGLTDSDLTPEHGVCEIHFVASDFQENPNGRQSLHYFAVPTLNLALGFQTSSSEGSLCQPFIQLKETEVQTESNIFDEIGKYTDVIFQVRSKTQLISKKLLELEKQKLDIYLNAAEQKKVFEQQQKLSQFSCFKPKKINSVIKLDETNIKVNLPISSKNVKNLFPPSKIEDFVYQRSILSENTKNLNAKISDLLQDLECLKPTGNVIDFVKNNVSL